MVEYIFYVHTGVKGFYDFVFDIDPDQSIGSAFSELINESKETGEVEIETHEVDHDGIPRRREWNFFWTAEESGEALRLDPDLSFNEEGIPPGSRITVSIPDMVSSLE